MFKVIKNSAAEFVDLNEDLLLQNETLYNIIVGWSKMLATGERESSSSLFYTVYNDNEIIGQAIRTDPTRDLLVTEIPEDAIEFLIGALRKDDIDLAGISGPIRTCNKFIEVSKLKTKLNMHQGIYECHNVIMPEINCKTIVVTHEHRDIVNEYMHGFFCDCFPDEEDKENRSKELAKRYFDNGNMRLLVNEHGEICSVAAKNRESKNAATISLVYTPKEHRKKGYASQVVALITEEMLKSGKKFCNLHTDLENPTSNSIYQKIGYKKLGESINYKFLD